MSAARNTKKGPHRNQQRRAREFSDASGMSYQSALHEVRRFDNLDRDETDFSPNAETLMGGKRKMNNSEAEGKLGLQLSHAPDGPALDEDADGTWEFQEDSDNRYECYAVKDGQSRDFTVTTEDFEIAPVEAPSCIKKVYFYGNSAGEEDLNLADFVCYHIQDEEVGLRCAEDLLRSGESNNDDEHEMVHETYTVLDRAELQRQVKAFLDEALREDEVEFEFDASLLS